MNSQRYKPHLTPPSSPSFSCAFFALTILLAHKWNAIKTLLHFALFYLKMFARNHSIQVYEDSFYLYKHG